VTSFLPRSQPATGPHRFQPPWRPRSTALAVTRPSGRERSQASTPGGPMAMRDRENNRDRLALGGQTAGKPVRFRMAPYRIIKVSSWII
jgi:hypothetical protein